MSCGPGLSWVSDQGAGLGGGEDDTISFTDDPKVAEFLQESMEEMRQVQAGEFTVEQMIQQAESGEGASRPFINGLLEGNQAEGEAKGLRIETRSMPFTLEEFLNPKMGSGPDGTGWVGVGEESAGGFTTFTRPLTMDEAQGFKVRLYNRYSALRADAGGPDWPIFFDVDPWALASKPPSEISTVVAHPIPGAQGYQMGGLGEWRSTTGDNVQVEIPEGEKLRKALLEKHYPGGHDHDQSRHGKRKGGLSQDFRERLGQCYVLSGRYVIDHEGSTLVHGSIQGMGNPRINHAWVMMSSGKVYDPVLDQEFEPEAWKALFNAVETDRYDREGTMVTVLRERNWGPWG